MALEDTYGTRRTKAAGAAFTKSARYVRVQNHATLPDVGKDNYKTDES